MFHSRILVHEGSRRYEFCVGCAEATPEFYPSLEVLRLAVIFTNDKGKLSSIMYNDISDVNPLVLGDGCSIEFCKFKNASNIE